MRIGPTSYRRPGGTPCGLDAAIYRPHVDRRGCLCAVQLAAFSARFPAARLGGFYLLGRFGGTTLGAALDRRRQPVLLRPVEPAASCCCWRARSRATTLVGQRVLRLAEAGRRRAARRWLAAGIALNLGLLGWFKYAGFFAANLAALLGLPAPDARHPAAARDQLLHLPADHVPGGQLPAATARRRVCRLCRFHRLLPAPDRRADRPPARDHPAAHRSRSGARRAPTTSRPAPTIFLLGLAKKLVLADTFAHFSDVGFNAAAHGASLTFFEAWYAARAYGLQIYFDFSGYSDMAIGLARMLNVRFPVNFASPYQATDIAEFWRRWHMTLGGFLRDYLYIPLGGSRHGEARRHLNLLATMLLCGLWHGAAWRFVLWGGAARRDALLHAGLAAAGAAASRSARPCADLARRRGRLGTVPRRDPRGGARRCCAAWSGSTASRCRGWCCASLPPLAPIARPVRITALSRRRPHAELPRGHRLPRTRLVHRAGAAACAGAVRTGARLGVDRELRVHGASDVFRAERDAVPLLPVLMRR